MAKVQATTIWSLEELRELAITSERGYSVLLSSVVRTWGDDIALLSRGVSLYTRTYDDDTSICVLSIQGGRK